MDVIFIHGNYPAQFKNLAPAIGNADGNRVFYLTEREDAKNLEMKGLEVRIMQLHRTANPGTHHYLREVELGIIKGQAVLRELDNLVQEGVKPRVVITHGGTGHGIFIKSFLPEAIHISYFEWYFRNETTVNLVQDFTLDTKLATETRNSLILQELENCDAGVVPTEWQKEQFPDAYKSKLTVIFDGIDTEFFKPRESSGDKEEDIIIKNRESGNTWNIGREKKVISYATRGMEPLRGFPEFMLSLPYLFERNENLIAIIAGADRIAYSYEAPCKDGSWKTYIEEKINDKKIMERIIFTGLLDYEDYRKLLWRSDLHCYFTRPYVTSWSLFEAAYCGSKLAVNWNDATNYVCKPDSINWVDAFQKGKLHVELDKALNTANKKRAMPVPGYDMKTSMDKWQRFLNEALTKSNG